MDMLINIMLTECNRFSNEGRRMSFYSTWNRSSRHDNDTVRGKADLEMQKPPSKLNCMVAVVGYREDPELFTRALESYKNARGHSFMIVGIDGDDAEDQDMADVFDKVYSHHSGVIHIAEPLGEIAQRVCAEHATMQQKQGLDINEDECNDVAMRHCMKLARTILD
ncbi:hypothetical protein QQZ08_005396 [Neonectria magnoliae]|uniref:Uncharacterized protein n=1 Tax=Neonectria magnoliae TaxID=2732573 RepID=A0ABR1I3V1_9HYPO